MTRTLYIHYHHLCYDCVNVPLPDSLDGSGAPSGVTPHLAQVHRAPASGHIAPTSGIQGLASMLRLQEACGSRPNPTLRPSRGMWLGRPQRLPERIYMRLQLVRSSFGRPYHTMARPDTKPHERQNRNSIWIELRRVLYMFVLWCM